MNRKSLLLLAGITSVPRIVSANAGMPFVVLLYPPLVLALIPIIAVESWYYRKHGICTGTIWQTCRDVGLANILSTIIGIPLLFLAFLFGFSYSSHTILLAGVLETTNQTESLLMLSGLIIHGLTAFLVSVYVEYWFLSRRSHNHFIGHIKHVYVAHLYSYGFLIVVTPLLLLLIGLVSFS